jgi:hypothetical protein
MTNDLAAVQSSAGSNSQEERRQSRGSIHIINECWARLAETVVTGGVAELMGGPGWEAESCGKGWLLRGAPYGYGKGRERWCQRG